MSAGQVATWINLPLLSIALLSIPAELAVDRMGSRSLMAVALLLMGVFGVARGAATSYPWLGAATFLFGVGEAAYDGTTVVIILNVANRVLGIVVDSVSDVLPLKDEEIRPAPEFSAAIDASFVQGLASVNNRLLILVDIELLMTSPGMALVDSAKAAA